MDYTRAEEWRWKLDCLEAYYTMPAKGGMRRWTSEEILWTDCPNAEEVIQSAVEAGKRNGYALDLELFIRVKDNAVKHLIEAAPDLLYACREALAVLREHLGADDELVRLLRSAIGAAEWGRSSVRQTYRGDLAPVSGGD